MKFEELTGKIIGCAMKVHTVLGNGFQEVIYQRALAIEMEKWSVPTFSDIKLRCFFPFKVNRRHIIV